jgi:hypothetical protein
VFGRIKNKMKYVMMSNLGHFHNNKGFLIFPEFESHVDVVTKYGGKEHCLSAGFVKFGYESGKIIVQCFGFSSYLNIGPKEDDDKVISMFMNLDRIIE